MVNFEPLTDVNIADLKNFSIGLDVDNANLEHRKYGHITIPLVHNTGEELKAIGRSAWFQFTKENALPSQAFKKTLSNTLTFLPNEKAYEILQAIVKLGEQKDIGLQKFKEYANPPIDDRHRWVYLTDDKNTFEAEKGDKIKIGLAFGNGIGTGNALFSELFTFREVCSNGSIWGRKQLASTRVVHVKEVSEMAEIFLSQIEKVFDEFVNIKKYYQAMPKIKFSQKQLDFLYDKNYVSTRYMPEWIDVLRADKRKNQDETELKLGTGNKNLWDFFNSITEGATKNLEFGKRRISFDTFSSTTQNLHNGIIQIVDRNI